MFPFAWQSNKAILFYFAQNSVSERMDGAGSRGLGGGPGSGPAQEGVCSGVGPNVLISLKDNSAFSYGYMIYFFFRACAMTVLMLDVNPFNQPGVEVYKMNMFKLLGKI